MTDKIRGTVIYIYIYNYMCAYTYTYVYMTHQPLLPIAETIQSICGACEEPEQSLHVPSIRKSEFQEAYAKPTRSLRDLDARR